ncbi:MAG: hypothetical protein QOE53_1844, partial [Pseudonocardiales bacterium]|nr:hypothetical protein [Pseudonocardiales bacterium]
GGMLFPRLLLDVPVHEFCVRLVESTGVLLGPGSDCYDFDGHFRMGFATPSLADGLAGIDDFLKRQ